MPPNQRVRPGDQETPLKASLAAAALLVHLSSSQLVLISCVVALDWLSLVRVSASFGARALRCFCSRAIQCSESAGFA